MSEHPLWGNPFKKDKSGYESDVDFLTSVPIFDSLSKRQNAKLFSIMYIRHYEKDDVVFRQGDPGVGLYVVKEGEVEVFSENNDMTCLKISVLAKGDFFGETSLLNESPRSATIVSSAKTTLFGLFKPELLSLMDSDPKLGLKLIYRLSQIVSERLRHMNEQFSRFSNGS